MSISKGMVIRLYRLVDVMHDHDGLRVDDTVLYLAQGVSINDGEWRIRSLASGSKRSRPMG